MERLSDKLNKLLEESGLNKTAFAKAHRINKTSINSASNGHKVSNGVINLLVQEFGDEFKQYYESTICEICGKEFISLSGRTKMCSVECQKQKIKESHQRWVDQRSRVRTMIINNDFTKPKQVKPTHKPPEKTIGEFMSGGDYGDRQREYLLSIQKTQRMEIR